MIPSATAAHVQVPPLASIPGADATATVKDPIASTAKLAPSQTHQPIGVAGAATSGAAAPNGSATTPGETPSQLGTLGGGEDKRPAGRPLPSRDWYIVVECAKDGVIIYPGGIHVPISGERADGTLPKAVEQMIVRRKSMARPGEAPDRAVIQFRVRPDGLQTYYLAYPALEPLRVPMTRENLRAEGGQRQSAGVP
jgi:hypothetical protein